MKNKELTLISSLSVHEFSLLMARNLGGGYRICYLKSIIILTLP